MSTDNPQQEDTPGCTQTCGHDKTPSGDPEWVKGEDRQLPVPPEEAGMHAAQRQHYAELDFADRRPVPPPASGMSVVTYAEVSRA